MKKRKNKLAKNIFLFVIPIVNFCLIISVSAMLSREFYIEKEKKDNSKEVTKNEKMITVYFHNEGEIKEVPMEEYLMGVVPAEMPLSFHEEALKAQAIAARTYIINREKSESSDHKGASVCTDFNHCKAYITEEEAKEKWGDDWNNTYKEKIKKAVYDTKGMVITYDDEPISAVFHSTSSGKTENSEDVWQTKLPYLRSVESEGEENSPRYTSSVSFSFDEFKNIVKTKNKEASFGTNPKNWMDNITYNESGSVKTIRIGGIEFKGTEVRNMFSLRSTNFDISVNDNITFNVTGNGHGVGMSQYGANYAANNGYNYEKILKKYYQGVEISKIY